MTPTDLDDALDALALRRPLFHSEADLQHELAWELRVRGVGRGIRLERPFDLGDRLNVDLVVLTDEGLVALELKYWPRGWKGDVDGEQFHLKNRGAQDLGRYDFWKDVSRIEQLHARGLIRWGAAVAVTNDAAYQSPVRPGTMAEPFALHNGARSPRTLGWPRQSGTTRGREESITLALGHDIRWRPFGPPARWGESQLLTVVVDGGQGRRR